MEHFVVVVHAVKVGIGDARVGGDVAAYRSLEERHGSQGRVHDVRHDRLTGNHAVPVVRGRCEIPESLPGLSGITRVNFGRIARVLAKTGKKSGILTHRDILDEVTAENPAVKRGDGIVVAEVADLLHQVFLIVLQAVVVEVDIADGAEQIVVRRPVLDGVGPGVAAPGGVHAAGDVNHV